MVKVKPQKILTVWNCSKKYYASAIVNGYGYKFLLLCHFLERMDHADLIENDYYSSWELFVAITVNFAIFSTTLRGKP